MQYQHPVSRPVDLVGTWLCSLSENLLADVHFCAVLCTKNATLKSLCMNGCTLYSYLVGFKEVGDDKQWAGYGGQRSFNLSWLKLFFIAIISFRKLENIRAKRNLSSSFFNLTLLS